MSETQVAALDHTIQLTNVWLKKLAEEEKLGDRPHAYGALRAVLHALRDRLTPEQAVHFGAQLPMLLRGLYYEGWHMADKPMAIRNVEAFENMVDRGLPPGFPVDAATAARAVFAVIWRELDFNESAKVVSDLPMPLRELWPEAARDLAKARAGD
jgi:uncharacterized protein (DUF2267 family)